MRLVFDAVAKKGKWYEAPDTQARTEIKDEDVVAATVWLGILRQGAREEYG